MFNLKGRVVAITGASSGLGVQMAKGFAAQGADLVIMARRKEKLDAVAVELRAMGARCLSLQCDVTNTEMVNKAAESAIKEYGKIDILVNNAGSAKNAGITTMTDEEWDFTILTDLSSVFKVTRAFSKYMVEKNYGRIITIASIYGMVGNIAINTVAYHSAKGGVVNFTKAVAAELAKYHITCNAICPGFFATELTEEILKTDAFQQYIKSTVPMGRSGNEGELNSAAIFLASDEASYVTGAILPVDGGYLAI